MAPATRASLGLPSLRGSDGIVGDVLLAQGGNPRSIGAGAPSREDLREILKANRTILVEIFITRCSAGPPTIEHNDQIGKINRLVIVQILRTGLGGIHDANRVVMTRRHREVTASRWILEAPAWP